MPRNILDIVSNRSLTAYPPDQKKRDEFINHNFGGTCQSIDLYTKQFLNTQAGDFQQTAGGQSADDISGTNSVLEARYNQQIQEMQGINILNNAYSKNRKKMLNQIKRMTSGLPVMKTSTHNSSERMEQNNEDRKLAISGLAL